MKNYHVALFIISALITNNIIADEIEEVIVTSSYINQSSDEIKDPLHIITEQELETGPTQSLIIYSVFHLQTMAQLSDNQSLEVCLVAESRF